METSPVFSKDYPPSLNPQRLVSEIAIMLYFLTSRPHFTFEGFPAVPKPLQPGGTDSERDSEPSPAENTTPTAPHAKVETRKPPESTYRVGQTYPGDHQYYSKVISEYNRISAKVIKNQEVSNDDLLFLLQVSDFLGERIKPATSESIAFSELSLRATFKPGKLKTSWSRRLALAFFQKIAPRQYEWCRSVFDLMDKEEEEKDGVEPEEGVMHDVNRAFPGYADYAKSSFDRMRRYRRIALNLTTASALISIYIFLVSTSITNIAELRKQTSELERTILSRMVPVSPPSGGFYAGIWNEAKASLPSIDDRNGAAYCPPPPDCAPWRTSDANSYQNPFVAKDPERRAICNRWDNLRAKRDEGASDLDYYVKVFGVFGHKKFSQCVAGRKQGDYVSDSNAAAILGAVNRCVLPILLGILGGIVFILRNYGRKLRDRSLIPRDISSTRILLVLGVVVGVIISLFYLPSPAFAESPAGLVNFASISAPAIAFLAAYAVEHVLGMLDRIAIEVFHPKA